MVVSTPSIESKSDVLLGCDDVHNTCPFHVFLFLLHHLLQINMKENFISLAGEELCMMFAP